MSSSSVIADLQTAPDDVLQEVLGAALRLYAARVESAGDFAIVPPSTITATDAMIATTALLRAVNVQLFELGLWQAWAH